MQRIIKNIKNFIKDYKATNCLKKVKMDKSLKFAFLVNEPSLWEKQRPVFEEIVSRNIDANIIVLPKYSSNFKPEKQYNDEWNFFSNYSSKAVKAYNDSGNIINLKELGYTHVFYPVPYNELYPNEIKSNKVAEYSKVCYITYGYTGASIFNDINTNDDFFRYVSYAFMSNDEQVNILKKRFAKNCEKRIQHFCNLGYPVLEYYSTINWNNNCNNILWTPRWSYDDNVGGSHFFELKEEFINIVKNTNGYSGIIRPHPLMFTNFIKEGRMDKEEKERYLNSVKEIGISLSNGNSVEEDYNKTSILITDYSSIIAMYMLTGKPIIYCESQIKFNDSYNRLKEGMYIAKNTEDVSRFVRMIVSGNDIKKDKRKKIVELLKLENKGATKNIVNYLLSN